MPRYGKRTSRTRSTPSRNSKARTPYRTRRSWPLHTVRPARAPAPAEVKYFPANFPNVAATALTGTGADIFEPQAGVGEHAILGNKCVITGMQMRGQVYLSSAAQLVTTRLIVVYDTQPSTTLSGYDATSYWRDVLLEHDNILSQFTHQSPRRFKVLHDQCWCLSTYTGGLKQGELFDTGLIKLNIDHTVYDYAGAGGTAQQAFNGAVKMYFFSSLPDNTALFCCSKVFFTDA